uniref:Uncharacterized protein n=1 Tax=Chenopodium quinoa TaxID=63459 RepID=A0A803M513_CHEQI
MHFSLSSFARRGWLVEVPCSSGQTNGSVMDNHGRPCLNENGVSSGPQEHDSPENRFPFVNSENPVMALVAFLASAVGPELLLLVLMLLWQPL